jgi:hypothetical protein
VAVKFDLDQGIIPKSRISIDCGFGKGDRGVKEKRDFRKGESRYSYPDKICEDLLQGET